MSDEGEGLRASSSSLSPPSSPSSPASAGQTHLPQPPRPLKRRASAPLPRTDHRDTRSRDASPRDPLELIGRSPAHLGRCCGASPVRDGLQNRGQRRHSPHRPDHETRSPEELIETPHSCAPPHA